MNKLLLILISAFNIAFSAFAQIGSLDKDLVYTPVSPCRVFDTRTSQGGSGAIAAAGTKNFSIWGVGSYASQGGALSNCGITAGVDTAAVAINVTVVTPSAGGFVTAFPYGAIRPTSATVNFQAGDIARGNLSIAKVSQNPSTPDLSVYTTSNADVVGDVVGYYARPVATELNCNLTPYATVAIAAYNATANAFAPACSAGFSITSTYCRASSFDVFFSVSDAGQCTGKNIGDVAATISARYRCCRIPGR